MNRRGTYAGMKKLGLYHAMNSTLTEAQRASWNRHVESMRIDALCLHDLEGCYDEGGYAPISRALVNRIIERIHALPIFVEDGFDVAVGNLDEVVPQHKD